MADPLFTPALVGAVVSALLAEVINVAKRAYCCKAECGRLMKTLEEMSPLLDKVVQKVDSGNDSCRIWLSDFEALLRDAKSATEKCARTRRMFLLKRSKLSSSITSIDQKIKEKASPAEMVILDIVQEVRATLTLAVPQRVARCPEFVMQPVPQKVVAFEANPFDNLKKLIMEAADAMGSPTTLGLKGRGGAGKTTVAQMLNNDPDIGAKYGAGSILWITIGHDAGDVECFQRTLGKFLNEGHFESWDHAHRSVEDRHAYLMQAFEKKKVLLILDDVWDIHRSGREMMYWLNVAQAPGSVTLITTRNGAILDRAAAKEKVAVPSLSEGESWELFCHYAFQSGTAGFGRCESRITKVAWEVCGECKGLPLALRVIGSAMRGKECLEEWRYALSRLRASEGLRNFKSVDDDLFGRLRFSYDELEEDTKKCFLYLAAFPEDARISIETLIAMWRAEDLFGSENEVDAAGWTHLLDLERRSLIELGPSGGASVRHVKVHDILRDLACDIIHKARPDEWASECLFQPGKVLETPSLVQVQETVKRMSFMEGGVPPATLHGPNLRMCLVLRSSKTDKGLELNLPEAFFSNMTDMRYLNMRGCQSVRSIPEYIKELMSLKYLDLSRTKLERLPEGIEGLTSLTHLNLSWTKLERLPEGIKGLTSLEYLDLSRTKLERLPEGIKELTFLVKLDLSWTKLEILPEGITELTSLMELNLAQSKLKRLPEGIKGLTSLVNLDCLRSKLEILPEGISELTSLTYLDLSGTNLESIPEGIEELTSLTYLDLSRTNLERLPEGITKLTSLTYLNLSITNLERVPEGITKLTSLTYLDLSRTNLKRLPEGIKELRSLTYFDLSFTKLERIPEDIKELMTLV